MKIFFTFLLSFCLMSSVLSKDYKLEKVKSDKVKITPIKMIKDIQGKNVKFYDEVNIQYMSWGNVQENIIKAEKVLANWYDETWLNSRRKEIQNILDLLNEVKDLLEKGGKTIIIENPNLLNKIEDLKDLLDK